MNNEIWEKIVTFDFDLPHSEYGFFTRLAHENFWTKDFTAQAILEYKKFMYLAATSEYMVSPSEIVDIVWHQHLIFTQSYQDFCSLIGKQIQHIPSTHNKEDADKFRLAKERTTKLYNLHFGSQPNSIWHFSNMYESLNLKKAAKNIRTFINIGILAFTALIIPFYFILKPVYVLINNPDFILAFIGLVVVSILGLEIFNKSKLKKITRTFETDSFIFNLHPFEAVFLKTQKTTDVINGTINELIYHGKIRINPDHTLESIIPENPDSIEYFQAIRTLKDLGKTSYTRLLTQLITKPVFSNTENAMNAFKKYFNKSEKFNRIFYINFAVLSFVLMLGFIRFVTGILRDKPATIMGAVLIALTALIIFYLNRLTNFVSTKTIPAIYETEILPKRTAHYDWQWQYFLFGATVLVPVFIPLVTYAEKQTAYGNTGNSSCGSSCGSSCSSCGGCGGGD